MAIARAVATPDRGCEHEHVQQAQRQQDAGRGFATQERRHGFPHASEDGAAHRHFGGPQLIVLDDVRPADVDRAEAFRGLIADAPEVRLAHPHDRVFGQCPIRGELREAQQMIRLVGTHERGHQYRIENAQAAGQERGSARRRREQTRRWPRAASERARRKDQAADDGQGDARCERQPQPGRVRPDSPHVVEQLDAWRGRRVVDEGAAHVVGPRAGGAGRHLDRPGRRPRERHEAQQRERAFARELHRQVQLRAAEQPGARPAAAKGDGLTVDELAPGLCFEQARRAAGAQLRVHQAAAGRHAREHQLQLLVIAQHARLHDRQRQPMDVRPLAALAGLERDRRRRAARRLGDERLAQRRASAGERECHRQHQAEQSDERRGPQPRPAQPWRFLAETKSSGPQKLCLSSQAGPTPRPPARSDWRS